MLVKTVSFGFSFRIFIFHSTMWYVLYLRNYLKYWRVGNGSMEVDNLGYLFEFVMHFGV